MTPETPTAHEAARLARDADHALSAGQLDKSEQMYRSALATFEAHGSRQGVASTLTGLGAALAAQGRSEDARATWERALHLHRELSDRRSVGVVLNNLGGLHLSLGAREEAASLLLEALELLEIEGESRRALEARLNLASLHHEAGRLELAQALAEQGAATARAILDVRAEGVAVSGLAAILAERVAAGETSVRLQARTVVQLYERAISLHAGANQPLEEAHARAGLGLWHLERGGFGAASGQLTAARDLLREAGDTSGLGWTLALLAIPEAAGGRVEPAIRTLGEAAPLLDSDPPRRVAVSVLLAAAALAACKGSANDTIREAERSARAHVRDALATAGDPPPSTVRACLRVAAALLGRDVFGPAQIAARGEVR